MALIELLRKAELEEDLDFLREGVRLMAQHLKEAEVTQHVGTDKYERTAGRSSERNGCRDRSWDTRVGSIELRVPRVRDGGYYPALRSLVVLPKWLGVMASDRAAGLPGVSVKDRHTLPNVPRSASERCSQSRRRGAATAPD
jgi:hypothetical protein